MRCLITGADGRLGRALTRAMTGRPDLTVWGLSKDRLDITSRSALERCMREFQPDWVVNAAAVTRAPEDRLYEYDRVNAEGAGFVAEAARAAGARILQVSTDYVFSGEGEAPWCERDRPSARGPYGRSKEEGEYAVMRSGAGRRGLHRARGLAAFGRTGLRRRDPYQGSPGRNSAGRRQTGGKALRNGGVRCVARARPDGMSGAFAAGNRTLRRTGRLRFAPRGGALHSLLGPTSRRSARRRLEEGARGDRPRPAHRSRATGELPARLWKNERDLGNSNGELAKRCG